MTNTTSLTSSESILKGLLEIGQALREANEPGNILDVILKSALDTFKGERGLLAYHGLGGNLNVKVSFGLDLTQENVLSEVSNGAIKKAFDTGSIVFTEDAQQDPRFAGSTSVILNDIRSICAMPLLLGNDTVGVMYLDSRLILNDFSEGSQSALLLYGSLAAQSIDRAMAFDILQKENLKLKRQVGRFAFDGIIGKSKAMEKVFSLMERVAPTDLPVLIRGESGTGKELVARAIHFSSSRSNKPFMSLFAGNLGEELLESELFGHKKGAFTGAYQDKPGLLTISDGGTLFLDEVADIPLRIQAKLLRILQDGSYKPVGDTRTLTANVRILSASNANLTEFVRAKKFREDLYYRINGIEVELPPLRHRKSDIPLLAAFFLKSYSTELNRGNIRFSKTSLEKLGQARWPGNVRELERTVHRAIVMCPGRSIEPEHLIFTKSAHEDDERGNLSLKAAEKRHILRVLEESDGNRSTAAESLGISRRYLQTLIKNWREQGLEI
jgi:Nif-specific regulatory protein